MEFLKNPNFDFLGKTRYFVTASVLLVLAGIVWMARPGGLRYGVEFSGGTQLILKFKQAPQTERIRAAVEPVAPGVVIQSYGDAATNQVLVRIAGQTHVQPAAGGSAAQAAPAPGDQPQPELDTLAKNVLQAIGKSYSENPVEESSSEIVGPIAGAELRRKAVWLTVLGLLFQLVYIGFRFNGAIWGSAAAIACFHDVLVSLAFLAFFQYDITLNVIAALLTLVGYSVNDTIVIFDRARENLRSKRKETLTKLLNDSLNQTLSRTILSNGTTFLAVLGLFLAGGEVLRGFAFTMVVGVLVGTYSTVYIASPIVIWWHRLQGKEPKSPGKGA
jgi:preprotein translocase subunit SecF